MQNEPPVLLSLNQVAKLTSLSRTAVNNHRNKGNFPKAVSLGDRRIGFVYSEVMDWLNARIAARSSSEEAA